VSEISPHPVERHDALVIGAGHSGLAAAAMLLARGVEAVVLEGEPEVASSWRGRYDGLSLNSHRWFSNLPGSHVPREFGASSQCLDD
jgi:cation diffusion facilitator CzcD-associated flavoprotein CzcO